MNDYSSRRGVGSADWLMSAIKNNPEGLLLLAAGCALLLRKATPRSGQRSHPYQTYPNQTSPNQTSPIDQGEQDRRMQRPGSGGKDRQTPEGISRAADTARDYASNVGKRVNETATSYASAAGQYVDDAHQAVKDQSGRILKQTQSTIDRIVREQPLAVVIAGLAAGAAVASAFPATRMERETLGPAGKRLSDAASNAGERLSEAASAAGEQLMSAAVRRGLNANAVKEVARDVAGTFEKSLTGGQQDDRSGKQGTASSGGGTAQYSVDSPGTGSVGIPGQPGNSTPGTGSRFDPTPPPARR